MAGHLNILSDNQECHRPNVSWYQRGISQGILEKIMKYGYSSMNSKLFKQTANSWWMHLSSSSEILRYSLTLVLVNCFVNVLCEDVVGMMIKCASDTGLEGVEIRYKIGDRIKVQNYLDMLQCLAKTNNMKCNKDKCKVLFLGPRMNYRNT